MSGKDAIKIAKKALAMDENTKMDPSLVKSIK